MISIGITGGIGSGKSTVCEILEKLAYPVFYADKVAKSNMHENIELINAITQHFGPNSYIDKKLNRDFLSKKIYANPLLKEKLNALVHPTVFQSYEKWKTEQTNNLVFNESALLYETKSYLRFDDIWLVTCDLETKIERLKVRDSSTREEIELKIKNQLSDEEKMKFSPKLIDNSANKPILNQILKLLETYN